MRILEGDDIIEKTVKVRKQFHLKIPDAIIAASCLVNDGVLVTRDREGFGLAKPTEGQGRLPLVAKATFGVLYCS